MASYQWSLSMGALMRSQESIRLPTPSGSVTITKVSIPAFTIVAMEEVFPEPAGPERRTAGGCNGIIQGPPFHGRDDACRPLLCSRMLALVRPRKIYHLMPYT